MWGVFARGIPELQIGTSRGEAFAALGERVSTPEVKNFVSALVQADRMGLPIAAVLREQTKEMRVARRQRAEEAAHKVAVKLVFPLVLCIFPELLLVLLGPIRGLGERAALLPQVLSAMRDQKMAAQYVDLRFLDNIVLRPVTEASTGGDGR